MKRSSKSGMLPGSLVLVGEKKTEHVKISVIDYTESALEEREISSIDECLLYRDRPSVTWIDIDGLHEVEVVEKIGHLYNLHPLIQEDILNTTQRPKLEDFGDYLYMVLRMIYLGSAGEIIAEQVSLVLGKNYVISFQETVGDVFDSIRRRLRESKGRLRKEGADHLAYSLIDAIVDNYFIVLERVGERIEPLEEDLLRGRTDSQMLGKIHQLKRDLIMLRKSVWPLREELSGLQRGESPLLTATTRLFLKDVYDHAIQVIDNIETSRDTVAGMVDLYLSSMSNRMNEIMKVLTMMSTIFIPLTFIAGIYGMNFEHMPELKQAWGYPLVLGAMGSVALVMVLFFRRKKWL